MNSSEVKSPHLFAFTRAVMGVLVCGACLSGVPARADYASTVLSQNPVGFWRLDETNQPPPQPILATNLGGLGAAVNGSILNGVVRGEPGVLAGTTDTSERFSNPGWVVTTVGPYVGVPRTPALNPTNAFTVEFWAKPTSVPDDVFSTVCSLDTSLNSGLSRMGYVFYIDGPNLGWQLRFGSYTGYVAVAAGGSFTPNTWSHVAGTFTGSSVALFVNGEQVAVTNFDGTAFMPNTNANFNIGMTTFPNRPFDGWIEEVAFYTNVLDPATLRAHFDAATTNGPGYAAQILADGPIGYWRLGEPPDPSAANLGSLGAAANGSYIAPAVPGEAGPRGPAFAGFDSANNSVAVGFGGSVNVPALNLNTNTVTITGWVQAKGPQGSLAAILCNRWVGTQFALMMDVAGGYGLGYTWNNDSATYNWDSGLSLPDSDWAFIALIVQPSQAALFVADDTNYLTFTGATNVLNHPPQAFDGTTLFGEDLADPARYFKGDIDEIAIFNRTLSVGEVFSQYAAAVDGVPPQVFADPWAATNLLFGGDTFLLVVDAGGTPSLSYQWQKDGIPIAGATTSQYAKTNINANDAGGYDVVITNNFGSITSQLALIQVSSLSVPAISQNPVGRTLYPGGTLNLAVSASGGTLAYQWQKDGQAIAEATNSTYVVAAVAGSDGGQYVVTVSNQLGSATSTPAVVTILVPAAGGFEAAIIADAPEAWWRLDDAPGSVIMADAMGRHDGTYNGLVSMNAPGISDQVGGTAVSFGGVGYGLVPFTPALNPPALTLECWAKTEDLKEILCPASSHFVGRGCYLLTAAAGFGQWAAGAGTAGFEYYIPSGTAAATMHPDEWAHLVITSDPTNLFRFYINGQWDGTGYLNFDHNSAGPMIIGGRGVSTDTAADMLWKGQVDEVAFYSRALSLQQIQQHYAAALYGTNTAPIFKLQPQSQVAQSGTAVSLLSRVEGSLPITLQWLRDSIAIPGATNESLTLTNLSFSDSATYALAATNFAGTNQSASATVTVMPTPSFANLTNGLLVHLKLDGDFSDSSGLGHDATSNGVPLFVAGHVGSGAIQVSTDTAASNYNYVALWSISPVSFGGTNSFSVSFWINYTNTPDDLPFVGNALGSTFQEGWVFADHLGQLAWTLVDTNASSVVAVPTGGPALNDGTWHNVVGAFDFGVGLATTYIDGVVVKSRPIAPLASLGTGQPICLGQDPSGVYPVDGFLQLDDLGIWSRALSAYDAQAIYQLGQAGASFDTYGPVTLLELSTGAGLQLIWQAGTLLQADSAAGPWSPVPGASAPVYNVSSGAGNKFYRIEL